MLKRATCVIISILLAAAACFCVSAGDILALATGKAPDDLRFVFTYPNEGSECIEAVFSVPDALCAVASANLPKEYERNMDSVSATEACLIQFDWSIDSRDAFHYDKSWDAAGGDYPVQQLSGSFAEKKEVFWFAYPQAAARCEGALKEQTVNGAAVRAFDFDAHKLYVRARFMVYAYASQTCTFSDWSDVYDVGKDLKAETPKVPGTGDDRPAVTDAKAENGMLSFNVAYPDGIRKTAYAMLCFSGATLTLESQLRADDGEWQYWLTENSDLPYLTGERTTDISELSDAKTIEYRCRLIGNDPTNGNAIVTGWSDYVMVKNGKAQIAENDDPFGKKAEAQRLKEAEREANKCKVCGICPFHPLGVCMFIWLGGLLLVVLAVVYFVIASKKKKQHEAETRAREEASRKSEPDKTGSFIQTDRITLRTQDEPPAEETEEGESDEA